LTITSGKAASTFNKILASIASILPLFQIT
jgi:hypothetical protein